MAERGESNGSRTGTAVHDAHRRQGSDRDRSRADRNTKNHAPTFETGDERYAWLNRVQAVGKGIIRPDRTIDYEFYEVR